MVLPQVQAQTLPYVAILLLQQNLHLLYRHLVKLDWCPTAVEHFFYQD
jgi:hypothetical protein